MKILGEELGNVGRWYIALPPLLLVGFLAGLLFLAVRGQTRLNSDDERVHDAAARDREIDTFATLIVNADAEKLRFLLTGLSGVLSSGGGQAHAGARPSERCVQIARRSSR
jgi:hypothetical protein